MLLAGTAAINYLSFIVAALLFFNHSGRKSIWNSILKVTALASAFLQVFLLRDIALKGGLAWGAECMLLGALGLFLWTLWTTQHKPPAEAFCERAPRALYSRGPYRWMRHPFYVSYLLSYCGGVVGTQSGILGLQTLGMAALYAAAIRFEEKRIMASPLARQYEAYRQRVGILGPSLFQVVRQTPKRRRAL